MARKTGQIIGRGPSKWLVRIYVTRRGRMSSSSAARTPNPPSNTPRRDSDALRLAGNGPCGTGTEA
jgi:hypothetical protein